MVVGRQLIETNPRTPGINRGFPGPRVSKHYRWGRIEVTRGRGGFPV
jgi:hypothetical protein